MPVIFTFFGIIIRMYYKEHEPAHFHAEHRGEQATFTFDGQLLTGAIKSQGAVGRSRPGHCSIAANWCPTGR